MKNLLCMLFILGYCLSLSACGPKAKVTYSWSDPEIGPYRAKNILVIGVSRQEASLKLWENIFVDRFTENGVNAMANYKVVGPVPEPDRKAVEAAIHKAGAASVLISHVVDSSSTTYTHPGTIHYEPRGFYGGMYGHYGSIYQAVYTPPVDSTRTVVRLESNLYDVATAKLIWSAQSEAIDPKLLRTDFARIVNLLIADMKNKGVLH